MQFDEFRKNIILSVRLFSHTEKSLFSAYGDNLREEGISHQLACKMSCIFKNYDVDCEYSRQLDGDPKKNSSGATVRPDIIIHKRGVNDHNLAVLEVKWDKNTNNDNEKITQYSNLQYKYGIEVRFGEEGYAKCLKIYDFQSKQWHDCLAP